MPIETLVDLFLEAASHDKPDCMMEKVGGAYRAIPTSELVDRVLRLAMALRSLGVSRGDRVALMAENGPHWPTVDFATLGLGAILVPVYPTLPPNQATYVINDSGAKVLVVEEHETMAELLERREEMPAVEHYVAIRGDGGPETTGLDELLLSAEPDRASFEESAKQCKPDDVATFIYTSGTTGKPKGVMLSHGNIASNVVDVLKVFPIKPEYTTISFLPLSHSFERTVDYIYFYLGCSVAYAESVNTLAENLIEVRPNLFVS
ncbi:MAG TPA: AMP-binding protein, partial [Thermoanaerobaculia bacterium]|nr:AMP-binding protein [Thermoanaerobaculia bacterium]